MNELLQQSAQKTIRTYLTQVKNSREKITH